MTQPVTQYEALNTALVRLESAMRAGDIWQQPQPGPADLASREPFCADTMTLAQWLRYVLIPRLRALMADEKRLPANADIAPAAEVYLKDERTGVRLPVLEALRDVDHVLTRGELRPAGAP